jgi:hypothetical protein
MALVCFIGGFHTMRLSSATAKAGSLVVLATLLARCSAPQASQSLPLSPPGVSSAFSGHPDVGRQTLKGRLTPLELLELQAEGKLPTWVSSPLLQRMIKARESRRLRIDVGHNTGRVVVWTSNSSYDYLIGLGTKHIIRLIDTASNGCYAPFTVKVDHQRNVWTACELNKSIGGAVQEYSSAGVLKNSYAATPPCNPSAGCQSSFGYLYDGGATAETVYGAVSLAGTYTCNMTRCDWQYYTGFVYWPRSNPSADTKFVALPYGDPGVESVGFMDLDKSGNIWFDYYGCRSLGSCGYALGELTNATSPSFGLNTVFAPGSFDSCPAGIYVSNQHGAETLSVTDRCSREIYQYHMPVTSKSRPFKILGPTPSDLGGHGEPLSGGFNKTDTSVVQADAYGWLDTGEVSRNKWTTTASIDTIPSLAGAAYTPSDR